MNRLAFALAALTLATLAPAHWLDHAEQPAWARRGYAQCGHGANVDGRIKWAANGYGLNQLNLDLLLSCGRNLQQCISYLDGETRAAGEAAGLKRQPYICSKTIWWRSEFPRAPQLEKCTVVNSRGERVLLYNNPERYGGCYSSPLWLQYMQGRIDDLMADTKSGPVHSIFFDNAANYGCYCADCRERFRAWSKQKYGEELDLTALPAGGGFQKALFDADTAVEFFKALKGYLARTYGPGIPISPNIGIGYGWSDYLVNRGATDLVMIEAGFTMPPTDSTVLGYKEGLAASHGLTTTQLLGLSETLRHERALALDKGNELGILESFVYPEEHMLALAEAAATGGTDMVSFALREQKISVDDRPYQVQRREAIRRYAQFQQQHLPLWDLARPGAEIGVVHGVLTQLADRNSTALQATARALQAAGLPYEVLVEEDLTPEQLADYRVLILPRVRLLDRTRCEAVGDWIGRGGVVVELGETARADELDRPYAAAELPLLARALPGDPQPVGKGFLWRPAGPEALPPAALTATLGKLAGPLDCRLQTPAPKLFVNVLRTHDGTRRTIHLVNSDVSYDRVPSPDLRDDDGSGEARTFFGALGTRARKVLLVPDLEAAQGYALRFYGATCGSAGDGFSIVVELNGRELKTFKGSELNAGGWFEVPVPAGVLRAENVAEFRAIGAPNGHPDWFALRIDTGATSARSWWSTDDGKTWGQGDLSPDAGPQVGEYLVRLGPATDPAAVAKPEDFMGKCHVTPARDVRVQVRAERAAPAQLLSPDAPNRAATVTPTLAGGVATYRVPEVYLYSLLVLPE